MLKGQIIIFQYLGYNGGFAINRKLLWKCEVVGMDGKHFDSNPYSWHGNENKKFAIADADLWAARTGFPIKDLGRVESMDDKDRMP